MKNVNYKKGFGPIAIIIVLALILGVGGTAIYSSKKAEMKKDKEMHMNATSTVKMNKPGSLRDLFSFTENTTCTFSEADANGQNSGTVYISGTSMRGDFTATSKTGVAMDSHMIRNGDTMSFWSGTEGMTMKTEEITDSKANSGPQSNVDLDKKVDYNCAPWNRDDSKFTLPSNVKFVDLGAMMQNMKGNINVDVEGSIKTGY